MAAQITQKIITVEQRRTFCTPLGYPVCAACADEKDERADWIDGDTCTRCGATDSIVEVTGTATIEGTAAKIF